MAKKMAPGQRALFTFLLSTLIAPALAALAVLLGSLAASLLGRADAPAGADLHARFAWAAGRALTTYVASALPSGLFGAVMAALVWRDAGVSWLTAAITGAVVATVFAAVGGTVAGSLTPFAFLGACVAVAIWGLAVRLRLNIELQQHKPAKK